VRGARRVPLDLRRSGTCLTEARRQVEQLRRELGDDPGSLSRREAAARERAARERGRRVKQALARMQADEEQRGERAKARPSEEKKEVRVSTTDPEARVMRMAAIGRPTTARSRRIPAARSSWRSRS
jgi:hypothetical protein